MIRPRTKTGKFRSYKKGERYAEQFWLIHGRVDPYDGLARDLWTITGYLFFAAFFAVIFHRAVGA